MIFIPHWHNVRCNKAGVYVTRSMTHTKYGSGCGQESPNWPYIIPGSFLFDVAVDYDYALFGDNNIVI